MANRAGTDKLHLLCRKLPGHLRGAADLSIDVAMNAFTPALRRRDLFSGPSSDFGPSAPSCRFPATIPLRLQSPHVFLLLFLLSTLSVRADGRGKERDISNWQPEITWFTSKNGLPTSMIFKVIEDHRGYIWLATNNGAIRYDGHAFRTYTTRDGLINNTVLNIVEDGKGRLWFLSLSKKLCYFHDDRIYDFAANPQLETLLDVNPTDLYFPDDGSILILPTGQNQLFRCVGDRITEIPWHNDPRLLRANYQCSLIGNKWLTLSETTTAQTSAIVSRGENWYGLQLSQKTKDQYYRCQRLRNGLLIAVGPFRMTAFDSTGRIVFNREVPEGNITSAVEDRKGDLWLLMRNGVYRYRGGDLVGSTPDYFLPDTYITSLLCDRAGNYWFSSWDNGLLCVPGIQFQSLRTSLSRAENSFIVVKVYGDRLWFLNTKGSLFMLEANSAARLFLDGPRVLAPTPESIDFIRDSRNRFWIGQRLQIVTPMPGKGFRKKPMPIFAAKTLCPLHDGRTAVGTANGFSIIRNDSVIFNSAQTREVAFHERTNGLCEDSTGAIWIGAISGLYRYDGISIRNYGTVHPLFRNRIVEIRRTPDGTMVLATQGAGVVLSYRENVYDINVDSGLASDVVRAIYAENDSLIWAGTNKGLSRITILSKVPFRYEVVNYSTAKGLSSNGVNSIVRHHGFIWLATDDGISRFNPDSIGRNMRPLPIEITEVSINGQQLELRASYELKHDRNNITISFIGIGFRTFGDIRYRYRLLGLGTDTSWHETVNRNIPFFSLPPGSYIFQVSSMNEDGVWNPEPREIRFRIIPHYSQTLWFRIGIILFCLLAIALIAWRIAESRRRKYSLEAQISELRQQALSANMNPHFISNALSVVQDYVLRHNVYEANEFLARFSRLIRLNLETSLSSFVVLEEELERLELYLSLEKLRFGDDLNYRIALESGIDPDEMLVPSMLVQPYVENAIWHGILPAGRPGIVEIEMKVLNEKSYTITIRDNGIGMAEEMKSRESERKSLSMELNRERLNLMSKSLKRQFSIAVSPRLDPSGTPCGTIVTITLPRNLPTL